ncbi:MAG: hypothetical protein Q3972_01235 [Corynebacterium sp.]|nr:hypothetical protein [Corynebacterium sp.]
MTTERVGFSGLVISLVIGVVLAVFGYIPVAGICMIAAFSFALIFLLAELQK